MANEASGESDPPDRPRWRRTLTAAGRWTLDVLRGYTWSRHLNQPKE